MTERDENVKTVSEFGRELGLVEHLTELRSRIIRSLIYVTVGTVAGWCLLYPAFFKALSEPVALYLSKHGGSFLITGVADGFFIKMQMSVLIGIMLAFPLISWEGWAFVSPGLTREEKKGLWLVAPLSILLFVGGVAAGYWVLPAGINWLAEQNPPGAVYMPSVQQTVTFILKMCLAFGLAFQMPVVLMFLAKVGIINSALMKKYWRQAVVGISIVAAVITPSNDWFSMTMMCIPMIVLYALSIGLVRAIERRR